MQKNKTNLTFTNKNNPMIKQGDSITNARTGQRMIFLQTWAETNGTQLQIECFSPVTSSQEPEHIHPYQENRFRIIKGDLCFRINGKEQMAQPENPYPFPKMFRIISGIPVRMKRTISRNFIRLYELIAFLKHFLRWPVMEN